MAISFEHEHEHGVSVGPNFRAGKPDGMPGGGGGGKDKGGGGSPELTGTYTSGPTDTLTIDYYNVTLNFYGDWSLDAMNAMAAAADYLSSLITLGFYEDEYLGVLYDDLSIDLILTDIDGQLGIAAQGTPTSTRSSNDIVPDGTTLTGEIQFDSADISRYLSNGTLDDLGLHEMLHVMGVGTMWEIPGFRNWVEQTSVPNLATKNPNDVITTKIYVGEDGTQDILLDSSGGHLDEGTYGSALMTPIVDVNGNYLSGVTVGLLEDLGYTVDAGVAAEQASSISLTAEYAADVFALA